MYAPLLRGHDAPLIPERAATRGRGAAAGGDEHLQRDGWWRCARRCEEALSVGALWQSATQ